MPAQVIATTKQQMLTYVQQFINDFLAYKIIYIVLALIWAVMGIIFLKSTFPVGNIFQDFLNFFMSATLLGAFALSFLILIFVQLIDFYRKDQQGSLFGAYGQWLYRYFLAPKPLCHFMHTFFIIYLFATPFVIFKGTIPALNGFVWDETFAKWDRILFFGHDPYQVLFSFLIHPVIIFLINFFYNLWFFVVYIVFFFVAINYDKKRLCAVYLMATILTWIIGGNLLATIFSSAGPCFYDKIVTGSTYYLPLMDHLNQVNQSYPIWSLEAQNKIWKAYSNNNSANMISAMPSMHVASSLLMALFISQLSQFWGRLLWVFFGLIFVGSIVLGWHYAVDGLFAIPLAIAAWKCAGYFFPRQDAV